MAAFPVLRTGAVTQYPADRAIQFSTQILRFVDGAEQRFREVATPIRRWAIQVSNLDDAEMNHLREFFRIQGGGAQPFTFTDPWDGTTYRSCNLETDEMVEVSSGPCRGGTTLVIRAEYVERG